MKHPLFTSLLIFLTAFSFGQQLPYVGPGQTFVFPNVTTHFINSGSINWALDTEEMFSFANSNKVDNENIFNLLFSKAFAGKLDAYNLRRSGFEGFENSIYSEYDRFPSPHLTNDEIKFIQQDSTKTIKFHEVFYIDNYTLKCKIISAALMTNYVTSRGISLGMKEMFYCCKNTNDTTTTNKNKELVHLKRIERVLNLDSVENSKIIKQTYGFNLIQSIWYGASKGSIKILDTKTSQTIAAKNVMNYSYLDSVQVQMYDSTGAVIGHTMSAGESVFPHKLTNSIQFVQDFFFDRRKNTFISLISECYLFVKNMNDTTYEMTLEKRFKIL